MANATGPHVCSVCSVNHNTVVKTVFCWCKLAGNQLTVDLGTQYIADHAGRCVLACDDSVDCMCARNKCHRVRVLLGLLSTRHSSSAADVFRFIATHCSTCISIGQVRYTKITWPKLPGLSPMLGTHRTTAPVTAGTDFS